MDTNFKVKKQYKKFNQTHCMVHVFLFAISVIQIYLLYELSCFGQERPVSLPTSDLRHTFLLIYQRTVLEAHLKSTIFSALTQEPKLTYVQFTMPVLITF